MTKTTMTMSNPARRLFLAASLALFALGPALPALAAQPGGQSSAHIERTVDGKVVNKSDTGLGGSVVYLKDTRSLSIKTYICDEAGLFHFGQLAQNTDYDLWAESNGVKSNTKSISSFDDKPHYFFTLTVK